MDDEAERLRTAPLQWSRDDDVAESDEIRGLLAEMLGASMEPRR